MPKQPRNAFTITDLARWRAIANAESPDTPPQQMCETAPQIRSFTTMGGSAGLVLVLKLDNGETLVIGANPFIASKLAQNILATGKHMQWLDKDNEPSP